MRLIGRGVAFPGGAAARKAQRCKNKQEKTNAAIHSFTPDHNVRYLVAKKKRRSLSPAALYLATDRTLTRDPAYSNYLPLLLLTTVDRLPLRL